MSHLDHIVKLKQELIREGIVCPNAQSDIATGAYAKALITHSAKNEMSEDQRIAFHKYILSYWNETTPNKGHVILATVGNFCRALRRCVAGTLTANELVLPVVPEVEGVAAKKYIELPSYAMLIETLVAEADKKLPQFLAISE